MERYKKLIIVIIAVAAAGILIVSFVARQPERPGQLRPETDARSTMPAGPLLDQELKVLPVEELGVDISNPQSLAVLGDQYFEKRQYNQAIEIYKKVLEIAPTDIDTYNDLGLAYHYTNRSVMAIDTLKKGTEITPSYQRIWLSLGFVLLSTGNSEEARKALEKAAEMDPRSDVGQEAIRMIGSVK